MLEHSAPSHCPNCGANFWELVTMVKWVCLECKHEELITNEQNEGN